MFIKDKKDILNHKYQIDEHPDNTELENWLSWIHISKLKFAQDVANIEYELENLKDELEELKFQIFMSLSSEDYTTIKAKKAIVEGRSDVRELSKKIYGVECDLHIAKTIENKNKGRSSFVYSLASTRASTSNFEENVDWVVKKQRGR